MNAVLIELNETFHNKHIFGTAYNPRSQKAVEGPNHEFNDLMKILDLEHPDGWDLMLPYAMWSWRTTPRLWLGGHSPYECLTGLRARMPMDILQATSPVAAVSQQEFVQHLVTKLRNMHSAIRRAKEESHRAAMKRALEQYGPTKSLSIGDYVLVERPPRTAPKVSTDVNIDDVLSRKFALKFYDEIFVVADILGAGGAQKVAVLADLSGALVTKFTNPVSIRRLQPLHFRLLNEPLTDEPRELVLHRPSGTVRAVVKDILIDGQVEIELEHGRREIIHLCREQYEWR